MKDHRVGGLLEDNRSFVQPYMLFAAFREMKCDRMLSDFTQSYRYSGEAVFCDFPNTVLYAPYLYLPQALPGMVAPGLSPYMLYMSGRLAVFLAWALWTFLLIRKMPVMRWTMCLAALLPMQVYLANSFSADTVNTLLCWTFFMLVIQSAAGEKEITVRRFFLLVAVVVLIACAKVIYVSLALIVFVIPSSRFGSSKRKMALSALLLLVAFSSAVAWNSYMMSHYFVPYKDYHPVARQFTTFNPVADISLQGSHLREHPLHAAGVIWNTLTQGSRFIADTFVGCFGTYLDVPLASWITGVFLALLFLVALSEHDGAWITAWQRIMLFGSVMVTIVLVIISQHLTWNAVGASRIEKLQGRYFFPVILPLLLAINIGSRRVPFRLLAVITVIFGNTSSIVSLFQRYHGNTATSVVLKDKIIVAPSDSMRVAVPGEAMRYVAGYVSRGPALSSSMYVDTVRKSVHAYSFPAEDGYTHALQFAFPPAGKHTTSFTLINTSGDEPVFVDAYRCEVHKQ